MSAPQSPLTYEGILELFRETDQRIDRMSQSVSLTAFSFGESREIGLGDGSETCYVSAFRKHP